MVLQPRVGSPISFKREWRVTLPESRKHRAERFGEAAPFVVRSHDDAGTWSIELAGELDLATAQMLERELKAADAAAARVIVLDLRELSFIDSSGLHVIINAHHAARGRLVIRKGPAGVQRAFEICGLLGLLEFADEVPDGKADDASSAAPGHSTVAFRPAAAGRANEATPAAAARPPGSRDRFPGVARACEVPLEDAEQPRLPPKPSAA